MKQLKIFFLMLVTVTTIGTFTSCEKEEDPQPQEDLWAKYETLAYQNQTNTVDITEYIGATFVSTGAVNKLNPYEWNKDTSGYPSIKFVSATQVLFAGTENCSLSRGWGVDMWGFDNGRDKFRFYLNDRNVIYIHFSNSIIEYKRQ